MAIVTFKETLPVFDPEVGSLYLIAEGEADVADSRETDETRLISRADAIIRATIGEFVINASRDRSTTYQNICDQKSNLEMRIANALVSSELACYGVRLNTFEPDEQSAERIRHYTKPKEAAAMTPEEIARRLEEAQRIAEAATSNMTPEEWAAGVAASAATQLDVVEDTVENVLADAGKPKAPKFCTNCGAPYKGGSFCGSCGTKLV